jgi:hypothetical protein
MAGAERPAAGDYPAGWAADVFDAAAVLVGVIEDIRHHEIGDRWDVLTDDPVCEIDRLRYRLDEMSAAVATARRMLRDLEGRAARRCRAGEAE